jgi:outer membrane protein assembly factor BamB
MAAPDAPRHRFWFPLLVLILAAAALATPFVLEARGIEFDPLDVGMKVQMISIGGTLLLLLLWWLFFSGFSWKLRLGMLVLLALAGVGFGATVSGVQVVTIRGFYIAPKFSFKWDKKGSPPPKYETNVADLTASHDDYPRFRGHNADGISLGADLRDWTPAPTQKWSFALHDEKAGYAGFAVAGKGAVTLEQRGKKEAVVCYDRLTGHERWAYEYDAFLNNPMGNGPRATPTIDHGDVFSFGGTGKLICLDGNNGKLRWEADVLADSEAKNILWGLAGSPLVVDNLVIVNPGIDPAKSSGKAMAAYDRKSGKCEWAAGDHRAGYSSPRLAKLCGVPQVLIFDASGLAGLDPKTGRELWRFAWETYSDMNIIVPLVVGDDQVFVSSEVKNGCALVAVKKTGDAWSVEAKWKAKTLASKFANPVLVDGHIYGIHNNNALVCIDVDKGEQKWKAGGFGSGQLVVRGDRLIVVSDEGEVVLVAADPKKYDELGRFSTFQAKTWNTPALAGNQLFLRNEKAMACYELPTN